MRPPSLSTAADISRIRKTSKDESGDIRSQIFEGKTDRMHIAYRISEFAYQKGQKFMVISKFCFGFCCH